MDTARYENSKPLHSAEKLSERRERTKRSLKRKRQRVVGISAATLFLVLGGTAAALASGSKSGAANRYQGKPLPTLRLDLTATEAKKTPAKRAVKAAVRAAAPHAHACPFGASYRSAFEYASRRSGVSLGLLSAVAMTESRINQGSSSGAGAVGVMQLMRPTAAALGVDPDNAWENIVGGAIYLAEQLDQFGEVDLALAAYNAGPGAVARHGGVPPYTETLNYISRVRGHLATFRGCV